MVTSKSPPEEILAHAIAMVAQLRQSGHRLSREAETSPYYVLDGRLYRVLADDSYTAFGDYFEFCARHRARRCRLPWQ